MSFDQSGLRQVHSHNGDFRTETTNKLWDQWGMGPVNLQSQTTPSPVTSEPFMESVSHNGDFRTETTNKLWDQWGMGPVNLQSQTPPSPVTSEPFTESVISSDDQDTMDHDHLVPIIPEEDFFVMEQMEQLGRQLEERRTFMERFRLPHEPRTRPFTPVTHMLPVERTSDFKYTLLTNDQFRLVALHPGRGNRELQCSLFTLHFDADVSYEAFSYAWGDPTRLHRVRCGNGDISDDWEMILPLGGNESIKVSPNLRDALYRLRLEDDFRLLWIDAICIHQDDDREKDEQVQRMAEIYSKAAKVLIWLGEEDNETKDAFNFIEQLAKRESWLRAEYPNLGEEEELLRMGGVRPWLMPESSPGYLPVNLWEAFRKLLRQRTWFMRTWVYQEVIMAEQASIHCGSQVVDWDTFYKVCTLISDLGIHNFDIYSSSISQGEQASEMVHATVTKGFIREALRSAVSLNRTDQDLRNWLCYAKLESLLMNTRFSSCTNPRDKIYALLSMVASKENIPRVDYGLSIRDLYVNVAKYWVETNLRNTESLSIFFSNVQTANPLHRLPSWVPDWSTPPVAQRLGAEDTLCAAGDSHASMHFVPYEESSSVFKPAEVHFLDMHITDAVDFLPNRNERENYFHKNTSLEAVGFSVLEVKAAKRRRTLSDKNEHAELIKEFHDPYPTTTESYSVVYSKVVNPRNAADFHRQPVDKDNLKFWDYITEHKQNLTQDTSPRALVRSEQHARLDEGHNIYRDVSSIFLALGSLDSPFGVYSRSFFVTTGGFMGIGPIRTMTGDIICILLGCKCPFVIRPTETEGRYHFVGECYVYGLMCGEAIDGLDQERIKSFIFD